MNHLIHAIATIDRASKELEREYEYEYHLAILAIEKKYAQPKRLLKDARKGLEQRLLAWKSEMLTWTNDSSGDTPGATRTKIAKSLRREKERKLRHAH